MGVGEYFPYNTPEELAAWQLEGTKYKLEDFDEKGIVELSEDEIWYDREKGLKFNTPSGKLEFVSERMSRAGLDPVAGYTPPYEAAQQDTPLAERRTMISSSSAV